MTTATSTNSSFAVAGVATPDDTATASERQPLIGEDWLAVCVGGAMLALHMPTFLPGALLRCRSKADLKVGLHEWLRALADVEADLQVGLG